MRKVRLCLAKRFFCPLAIVDVEAGSIPFDDFSRFVMQWHVADGQPAIFPIRPPHPYFMLHPFSILYR
jgi:hypothetical protein